MDEAYLQYEIEKKKIKKLDLTPEQYELEIKKITDKLKL
jgi:hypothetical protein